MAVSTDEIVSTLNQLIQTCKDGQEGFEQAAEGVADPEYKSLFLGYSEQRREFADELQTAVADLGDEPQEKGSVLGALHRGWINIKSAVSGQDEHAIIAECEAGEDAALETYTEALGKDLPVDLQAIIHRQYGEIQEAHDRIRSLERMTDTDLDADDEYVDEATLS